MELPADFWRDLVLALAVMAGVYLAILVLRLLRVHRAATPRPVAEPVRREPPSLSPAEAALARSFGVRAPLPEPPELRGPQEPTVAPAPPVAPAAATPAGFADELVRRELEREIQRLRRETEQLREALQEALGGMRDELERLKATRNVSPLYSEAASLAERGISPDGIAGRCGISLGEAELVAALARARVPTRDDAIHPLDDNHERHSGPERTGTHD